jgi:hypothetical protein
MPQPLPANPYLPGTLYSDAYTECVRMEAWAINRPAPDHGPSVLVCARLLGYMIIHAPIHEGRDNISNEIASCHNFREIGMVACKYIDHFVRCCECGVKDILFVTHLFTCLEISVRSTKGATPSPSAHPSRPSFSNMEDTFRYLMEEAPNDHRTAKQKVSMAPRCLCLPLTSVDLRPLCVMVTAVP